MGIQLYGFWRSIASFRVRVALRLKGLPFEEIPIDILSGEQFKPGYEAVNAERVVPTFIHDGHSVFQSLAIIEYLDDIQPTPRLIPADAKEREEIPIDILSGEQFKPGYEAVNAERVVPTFIHDGHSVFQSLAIIEYLDDIQPAAAADTGGREGAGLRALAGADDDCRCASAGGAARAQSSRQGVWRRCQSDRGLGQALDD